MCRLHSQACLLLIFSIPLAMSQLDSLVPYQQWSPLQNADMSGKILSDLHSSQRHPSLDRFWTNGVSDNAIEQDLRGSLEELRILGFLPEDHRAELFSKKLGLAKALEEARHRNNGDIFEDQSGMFVFPPEDVADESLVLRPALEDIENEAANELTGEVEDFGENERSYKEIFSESTNKELEDPKRQRCLNLPVNDNGRSKRSVSLGDEKQHDKRAFGIRDDRSILGPKRAPDFHSWGGKRGTNVKNLKKKTEADNAYWGQKRAPEFNSWGGKRSPAFNSWGGKRAPEFNSWGGKRSPAFNSWGGKRAPEFNSWGGKRAPEFNSWGGKRAPEFNSWGGKRSPAFNSWGGKRSPAFNSWGGKRSPAFNSWGGKRAPAFNSWGGKRAPDFNSWGGKRSPAFNSWGGKRSAHLSKNDLDGLILNPMTKEPTNILLEDLDILENSSSVRDEKPLTSLNIKKRSLVNGLDSRGNPETFLKGTAADINTWESKESNPQTSKLIE